MHLSMKRMLSLSSNTQWDFITTILLGKSIFSFGNLLYVVRRRQRIRCYFSVTSRIKYNNDKCNMSRIVRKPDFCLGENKGADQLRGHREADQRLCFRYSDSIIPLLLIAKISSI